MNMSIKIEKASKLAMKEIQAMPIEQLMAEIQANKNSQLAITITAHSLNVTH